MASSWTDHGRDPWAERMSVSPEVTPKFAASCQMSGLSAPCQAEGCSRPLCVWGVQEAEGLKDESSCKNTWATKKTSIDCFKLGRDRKSKIASRKVAKAHVMILFFSSRHANTRRWLYTIPTHSERTAKEPRFAKGPRKMQWAKSTSLPAKSPCF